MFVWQPGSGPSATLIIVQQSMEPWMRDASPALRNVTCLLHREIKIYLDCTEGTRGSTLEREIAPPGLYWRGLRIHPRTGEADASLC